MKTKQQKIVEILDEILSVNIQHDIEAGEINVKIINRQEAAATIIEQLEPEGEVSDKDITYWKGSNLGYHRKQFMKNSLRLEQLTMEKSPPQQPSDSAGEEVYVKVMCSDELPEKDDYVFVMEEGHYHLPNSCVYEKSEGLWFDRSGSIIEVDWWLKRTTRPTVSEEEMEKLNPWIKGNSKYYTPWEMGFKAAIKELLNR